MVQTVPFEHLITEKVYANVAGTMLLSPYVAAGVAGLYGGFMHAQHKSVDMPLVAGWLGGTAVGSIGAGMAALSEKGKTITTDSLEYKLGEAVTGSVAIAAGTPVLFGICYVVGVALGSFNLNS